MASFPTSTGKPNSASHTAFRETPLRAGRLGGSLNVPESDSTGPAAATPSPFIVLPPPHHSLACSIRSRAPSNNLSFSAPAAFLTLDCQRILPSRLTTAIRHQVPPQSIAKATDESCIIYPLQPFRFAIGNARSRKPSIRLCYTAATEMKTTTMKTERAAIATKLPPESMMKENGIQPDGVALQPTRQPALLRAVDCDVHSASRESRVSFSVDFLIGPTNFCRTIPSRSMKNFSGMP